MKLQDDTALDQAVPVRIRLWDLPTRLFHWSLVIAVLVAFVSAKIGGDLMEVHGQAGLIIIGLLAFRLVWGIVGSTHARFRNFAPSPSKLLVYLKGRWHGTGHNPLGALSVFALLGLLAAQAATGLFANDDIDFSGPFAALVEKARSDSLTGLHHQLSNVLLALLVLHIVAVVFYVVVRKNNLIKPMVTGWKEVPSGKSATGGSIAGLVAALLIALATVYGASGAALKKTPAVQARPANQANGW